MSNVHYVVNRKMELLACSEYSWDEFARSNDGQDIVPFPEGSNLLHSVAGREMQHLTEIVVEHVFSSSKPINIPFRCDSPLAIRRGILLISPITCTGTTTGAFFEARILDEQPRRFAAKCLQKSTACGPGAPAIVYCSQCSSVSASFFGSVWMDIEDYHSIGGPDEVRVIQSICPSCWESILNLVFS